MCRDLGEGRDDLLVDLEPGDVEVRVDERGGVLVDVRWEKNGPVLASTRFTAVEMKTTRTNTVTRAAVAVVDARDASPVTAYIPVSAPIHLSPNWQGKEKLKTLTERQVDHDVVRPEVAVHVAVRGGEVRDGRAPVVGVNLVRAGADVVRDVLRVARPEPDLDAALGALHRVEATAVRVERRSVRVCGRVLHAAARVARGVDVAVRPERDARLVAWPADGAVCGWESGWGVRGRR